MRKITYIFCLLITLLTIGCKEDSEKAQIQFIKTVFTEFDSISRYQKIDNKYNYLYHYPLYNDFCKKYCTKEYGERLIEAYENSYGRLLVANFDTDELSIKGMTIRKMEENIFHVHYSAALENCEGIITRTDADLKVTLCKEDNEYKICNVENISTGKFKGNFYYFDDLINQTSKNPELDLALREKLCGYWMEKDNFEKIIKITENSIGFFSEETSGNDFNFTPYVIKDQQLYCNFRNHTKWTTKCKCTFDKDTLHIRSSEFDYVYIDMFRLEKRAAKSWIDYIRKKKNTIKDDTLRVEIGTFDSIPQNISGRAYKYFKNSEDMENGKYMLVTDSAETAYVVINQKLEKFTRSRREGDYYENSYVNDNFVLRVALEYNIDSKSSYIKGYFYIIDPEDKVSKMFWFIGKRQQAD